ncbi:MAG: GDP-mannose 4,6-dehydratase [Oscillospiraceae bacterium]|nr:GDP-mannose 4,6-dehydratase [Oscillospiraceae bacterium]
MKALILGAAGFVGAYAIRQFAQQLGWETHAAKMPSETIAADAAALCTVHDFDLLDAEGVLVLLQTVQPDYILHLAAQSSVAVSWKNPQLTADINIKGTLHLLEAARQLPKMPVVLLVGSSEEYGALTPEQMPVREDTQPMRPANIYAVTKMTAEQLGSVYHHAYQLPVICVRAFNHIGPGQSITFAVADFCRQAAEIEYGLREPVIYTGNISAKRDFTDVRDIVRAYGMLLQYGKAGEIYNVGSGKAVSLEEIIGLIQHLCRVPFDTKVDAARFRPVDVPIVEADISKLSGAAGWHPEISLEQTIADILNEMRATIKETNPT